MRSKNLRMVFMVLTVFMMSATLGFADGDISQMNADKFGIWTLIPPVVAIVLAFITKNVVISLFIGIFSGSFILNLGTGNLISVFVKSFLDIVNRALTSLADPWNAGIILQVLAIGGVINLVAKMGGAKAIAEALANKAKNARSAQLITWFAGLLVFFEDEKKEMPKFPNKSISFIVTFSSNLPHAP